jgi:MFS transporter, DHA3 family, macrolide efflux protein
MKNIITSDVKELIKSKFLYVWISQILSQLTINIMNFLLLIKLYSETNSSVATSFLWVSYALPALLIGPFAAVMVDLFDKRKTLIWTNLLQALVVFVYAASLGHMVFLPYAVAFIYSLLNQFYLPSEAASVPELVENKLLARANSLFFITQQASLIIGFGLAGLINKMLGFRFSFFLCSIFLFLAFISVTYLPTLKALNNKRLDYEKEFLGFFEKIFEGYRFIRENNSILIPSLLLMSIQIILSVIVVDVPIIASDIFAIDINNAGILLVVPAGIGAAIGAIIVPILLKKGWRKRLIIERSIMLSILSFFMLIFLIPNQLILKLFVIFVLLIMMGASFVGIVIPSQTYLQEKTPGGLRGRVFGNFWFLTTIATMIPVILSGTISEIFGIKLLFFLIAVILFIGLMVFRKLEIKDIKT